MIRKRCILVFSFVWPLLLIGWWANDSVVSTAMPVVTNLPSFIGAEGHGAQALTWCRENLPLVVHRPTNTAELRADLQTDVSDANYDIIVPQFGGYAKMAGTALISKRCVYFPAQVAPGDGLTMSAQDKANVTTIEIRDSMIAIRYVRFRSNSCLTEAECIADNVSSGGGGSALSIIKNSGVAGANRVIVDHVSVSNSNDDGIVFWVQPDTTGGDEEKLYNTTVQRSLFGVLLNSRSTCAAIGGQGSSDGGRWQERSSWHHNLFYDCGSRSPALAGGDRRTSTTIGVSTIANLVYEHGAHHARPSGKSLVSDYINNVYDKSGTCFTNVWVRYTKWQSDTASFYASGNLYLSSCNGTFTGTDMIRRDASPWTVLAAFHLRSTPLTPASPYPVTQTDSSLVRATVLTSVGADERVNCSGVWVAALDSMDTDWISKTNTQTTPSATPVVPTFDGTLDAGTACTDTDSDGMPDTWEDLYANVSKTVSDADSDVDLDGWLAIEEYLMKCPVSGVSCSPDASTAADGTEGATPISPTYGAGRFVYYDTFGEYTTGSITRLLPDTSRYGVATADVKFGVIPKTLSGATKGDPVIIFADDSIRGVVAKQLDSLAAFDTIAAWALAGFNEDSLKAWAVP